MSTIKAEGTQAATVGTLHTLATVSDAGVYLLRVDAASLALGETLELEIHATVGASGTTRLLYAAAFGDVQGAAVKDSLAVPVVAGRDTVFQLRQTGGTGRSFPWEVHAL